MPQNPLNLNLQKGKDFFQANFYQRWAFFAPPPTYNQRLYFIFKNNNTTNIEVFEVLKPILIKKQNTAPFNFYYQTVDYILASSLINIDGNVRTLQQIFNYEKTKLSPNLQPQDSLLSQNIVSTVEKTTDFLTLCNYAKKIAINNGIEFKNSYYQIQISKINMPQFIDRNSRKGKEEITFSSHFFKF
jgi:hypothetical protein